MADNSTGNSAQLTDMEIIYLVLDGNKKFFELIIRRFNPYLYRVGRSYGFSHEDTQDLMQETFISAYVNLSKFENRSSFKTWIIRIMLNNCFGRSKKLSYVNEVLANNHINENSSPVYADNSGSDTNQMILRKELNSVIENSLISVPVRYRTVFILRESPV